MRFMWFGTRGFERWVRMPGIDQERGQYGWSSRSNHVSGGASIVRSAGGHQEYVMEWAGGLTTSSAQKIRDILDGAYDTDANRGLIYFLDPSAMRVNLFPKIWASPYLCGLDGPSLTKGLRPILTGTASNAFSLPARTATFTVGADTPLNTLYVPIPPGHSAHFALYGTSAQSNKYRTTPYTAGTAGSPTTRNVIANSSYGASLTTVSGVDGIEFSLLPSAGSVVLTAGILRVAPTGESIPAETAFASGLGHSGCHVDGTPSQVLRRAAKGRDREGLGARLVEVGSWL